MTSAQQLSVYVGGRQVKGGDLQIFEVSISNKLQIVKAFTLNRLVQGLLPAGQKFISANEQVHLQASLMPAIMLV